MPTLTNGTTPSRLAEWYYIPALSYTTSSGTLTSANWTTASDTTNEWIYRVVDPRVSDTDTSFTSDNITASNLVWRLWNEAYEQSLSMRWEITDNAPPQPRVLTPAEIEEQRRAERERQRQQREREQHRLLINTRADRLLRQHLTPEQIASLDRHGHFVVIGESGKRYRVRHGYARNVDLLDANGKAVKTYCAHPAEDLPVDLETGRSFRRTRRGKDWPHHRWWSR